MGPRDDDPFVSVVVPARNASATLGETLDSLIAQTRPDWEALVVDDDSTDDTRSIAETYATRDPRIRVLTSTAHSEGGARNVGIAEARAAWLLFLDADDLIRPGTFERAGAVLRADRTADGVVHGWTRFVSGSEDVEFGHWNDRVDPFVLASSHTPFPIHACIVRASLVRDVGMFDADVRGVADWDLWLRVFRSGARLVRVPDTLARYRSHPGAMSSDPRMMLESSLVVLDRAYRRDDRVRHALPRYADGHARAARPEAILRHLIWWAGIAFGTGRDPLALVDAVDGRFEPGAAVAITEDVVAGLGEAVRVPALIPRSEWPRVWTDMSTSIRAFLARVEELAGRDGLAWRSELLLQPTEGSGPRTSSRRGDVMAVDVELTDEIPSIEASDASRVLVVARLDGRALGLVEMLPRNRRVDAGELRDALSERWFWDLCRRFVERLGIVRPSADDGEVWMALVRRTWPGGPEARRRVVLARTRPVEVDVGRQLPHILSPGRHAGVVARVGATVLPPVRVAAAEALSRSRLGRAVAAAYGADLFRAVARERLIGRSDVRELG